MPMAATDWKVLFANTKAVGLAFPISSLAKDQQASGDKFRIFAAFKHAGQPIDGAVGVASANRFNKRRNDIVVLIASFVI